MGAREDDMDAAGSDRCGSSVLVDPEEADGGDSAGVGRGGSGKCDLFVRRNSGGAGVVKGGVPPQTRRCNSQDETRAMRPPRSEQCRNHDYISTVVGLVCVVRSTFDHSKARQKIFKFFLHFLHFYLFYFDFLLFGFSFPVIYF